MTPDKSWYSPPLPPPPNTLQDKADLLEPFVALLSKITSFPLPSYLPFSPSLVLCLPYPSLSYSYVHFLPFFHLPPPFFTGPLSPLSSTTSFSPHSSTLPSPLSYAQSYSLSSLLFTNSPFLSATSLFPSIHHVPLPFSVQPPFSTFLYYLTRPPSSFFRLESLDTGFHYSWHPHLPTPRGIIGLLVFLRCSSFHVTWPPPLLHPTTAASHFALLSLWPLHASVMNFRQGNVPLDNSFFVMGCESSVRSIVRKSANTSLRFALETGWVIAASQRDRSSWSVEAGCVPVRCQGSTNVPKGCHGSRKLPDVSWVKGAFAGCLEGHNTNQFTT